MWRHIPGLFISVSLVWRGFESRAKEPPKPSRVCAGGVSFVYNFFEKTNLEIFSREIEKLVKKPNDEISDCFSLR